VLYLSNTSLGEVYKRTHTHTQTHTNTRIHTYIHTYIHTHIYTVPDSDRIYYVEVVQQMTCDALPNSVAY